MNEKDKIREIGYGELENKLNDSCSKGEKCDYFYPELSNPQLLGPPICRKCKLTPVSLGRKKWYG